MSQKPFTTNLELSTEIDLKDKPRGPQKADEHLPGFTHKKKKKTESWYNVYPVGE